MKTLVVYDSKFGNTEKIAKAISSAIKNSKLYIVSDIKIDDLKNFDLIIVGSPTQGGRPTQAIQNFGKSLPPKLLKHAKAAAFDTRILAKDQKIALRLLIRTIGYAAEKIASCLKQKGAKQIVGVEGFMVNSKTGPLKEGELERAANWAIEISK
jgi:flavodoxin